MEVSFAASDSGQMFANLYVKGSHGVNLCNGAANNGESWHTQALKIGERGPKVPAIDFWGYLVVKVAKKKKTQSLDILAANDYSIG
tara:strand:- start:24692 stop:24949 length:258 start_codon:yes stop_codon:yes gene_type:complete